MNKKVLIILSVVLIVSCKANEGWHTSPSQQNSGSNSVADGADIIAVSLLKSLSEEELAAVSEGCPRESGRDFCVAICHVPPGNPSKAKTLLIPHQALLAHINHGSDKHNHHDFVGHCNQVPDLSRPHPGCINSNGKKKNCNDDSDHDDDSSSNSGSEQDDHEHDDSADDDTPMFCDPLHPGDLDCDGYDDETGTPLY